MYHGETYQYEFFHGGGPYRIETGPFICSANQWTGFYKIGTSVMKKLEDQFLMSYTPSLFTGHVVRLLSFRYVVRAYTCSNEEITNFFLGFLFASDFHTDYGIVPTNSNSR